MTDLMRMSPAAWRERPHMHDIRVIFIGILACWHAGGVIGRLEKTVIDCPDPRALAGFYCQVLGMEVNEDTGDWVVVGSAPGRRELAFQRVTQWVPPRWPDPAYPQQLHLDIRVSDADRAEQELLTLGAARVRGERETGFRVFTDPAGHPFCIVFGGHSAD
jgi:catechol 2,3-dioxygenase-like lactoylglutathione lyase family enzyme